MGGAGLVDDDRSNAPLAKVETPFAQRRAETRPVLRCVPGRQRGAPDVIEVDAGTLLDEPFARRQRGDRAGDGRHAGGDEPCRHVLPSVPPEGGHDGTGVLRGDGRHAVFVFYDAGDLLASDEIESQVND